VTSAVVASSPSGPGLAGGRSATAPTGMGQGAATAREGGSPAVEGKALDIFKEELARELTAELTESLDEALPTAPTTAETLAVPRGKAGSWPGNEAATVLRRADDLCALLRGLEMHLATPCESTEAVAATGRAYRELYTWTIDHKNDPDLPEVLSTVERLGMYPEQRRQALKDAYTLFYQDVRRCSPGSRWSGASAADGLIPPPPQTPRAVATVRAPRAGATVAAR